MESLTLFPEQAAFLIAERVNVVAGYSLWVVGYPPRYVGRRGKNGFARNCRAEELGSGWMALSRHERIREKPDLNPLEMIEKVVSANDWPFDRTSDR